MDNKWIDLHTHSTASDGTTPPEQMPQIVLDMIGNDKYNEIWLALTDHDTTAGIGRLLEAAKAYPSFHAIPGVEISCDYNGKEIHMVGLHIDWQDAALTAALSRYRDGRDNRNARILQRFEDIGIHIPPEALPVGEGETPGRPHIARYLMEHRFVASIKEAFDKYLKDGALCYVDREKPSPEEGIALIRNAGGIPVLAHPMQYHFLTRTELEELVRILKEKGLEGIEVYYTEFSEEETAYVEALAEKYDLMKSGGSDYHGQNKPGYQLGYGLGNLRSTMKKISGELLF